jgi:hypothetical protein
MLENDMVLQSDEPLSVAEPGRDVLKEIREHFGAETATIVVDGPTAIAR